MDTTRPPLAVAYGGGGVFGIAYLLGVGEALLAGGVLLREAPAIGTSAGSWAAASIALGVTWAEFEPLADDVPRRPDPREGRLCETAQLLFGEARVPTMRVVACALPRLRRATLSGADYPAADLVAASSAVPGLLAPHRIGKERYVDGGVRSMVSADLADAADSLLVIAPLAGPMFGPGGWLMERTLKREMQTWMRQNHDAQAWFIRPSRAIAALARRPDQLFDADRARRCYDLAYVQGQAVLERWNAAHPDAVR